jgi:hypothetical protein
MNNKSNKKSSISTFAIKIFFLIVIFFGFPYLLITFFNRYQTNALGIIEQQNAIVEIQTDKSNSLKVLTRDEADTLLEIHKFISGTWVSEFDGRYKIIIDENNKFEEYYDGVKEGFGVWRVFSGIKESVNLSTSPKFASDIVSKESINNISESSTTSSTATAYTKDEFENQKVEDLKYFLQKQQFEDKHKGEKYIYQIQQLDLDKFILVFKDGIGKPLVFIKEVSNQIEH